MGLSSFALPVFINLTFYLLLVQLCLVVFHLVYRGMMVLSCAISKSWNAWLNWLRPPMKVARLLYLSFERWRFHFFKKERIGLLQFIWDFCKIFVYLGLYYRVADMDTSSLVESKKASLFWINFFINVFNNMKPIITNHHLFLSSNFFVSFNSSFVKLDNLTQLILIALLVGTSNDASFQKICDVEIRKSWTLWMVTIWHHPVLL